MRVKCAWKGSTWGGRCAARVTLGTLWPEGMPARPEPPFQGAACSILLPCRRSAQKQHLPPFSTTPLPDKRGKARQGKAIPSSPTTPPSPAHGAHARPAPTCALLCSFGLPRSVLTRLLAALCCRPHGQHKLGLVHLSLRYLRLHLLISCTCVCEHACACGHVSAPAYPCARKYMCACV